MAQMLPSPLFATGIARGGSTLMTLLLNVHPDINLAEDPYLPLFKFLRNASVAQSRNGRKPENFDPDGPLDEYYYFEERLAVMRLVQASDLDIPFNAKELPRLVKALAERTRLSSPLLVPYLDKLEGKTYKALFESALRIVGLGHEKPSVKWVGFSDNWTVEFFAPLARAFPGARFIILIRDVRSAIASQLQLEDPALIALPLSFVRNWRKLVAFAQQYKRSVLFRGRLHVLTYEHLVTDPEATIRRLCEFLDVDFIPDMLDTTKFVGPHGDPWITNSSFAVPQRGIYKDSVDRWKKALPGDVIRLVEFVAGPELELLGYELSEPFWTSNGCWEVYQRLWQDHRECAGWRTDSRNPDIDFALELLRGCCLTHQTLDGHIIERCFLFPEVYGNLCERRYLLGAAAKVTN